jgi:hypothetical protein
MVKRKKLRKESWRMIRMEYEERKQKLFEYLGTLGIEDSEIQTQLDKEIEISKRMGMDDDSSSKRALVATINYYRKYLDKIGNRIHFICIGMSSPTDYGLRKKMMQVEKLYNDMGTTQNEREKMVELGLCTVHGMPLHHPKISFSLGDFPETTLFEDLYGQPIDINESISQELFGIVRSGDKHIPAVIRINGKMACDEQKYMYRWCAISAEQKDSARYAGYAFLTTRELMMKPLKAANDRVTYEELTALISLAYSNNILDCNDDDVSEKMMQDKPMVILKNVQMTPYTFQQMGTTTHIYPSKNMMELNGKVILADARISKEIVIDVDPNSWEEKYLCVRFRPMRPNDLRLKCDIYGMYVENPQDKSMFAIDEDFLKSPEEQAILIQNKPTKNVEIKDFFKEIQNKTV